MHKQNNLVNKFFIATAFASLVLTACKRDSLTPNSSPSVAEFNSAISSLEANGNSPAAHIAASEKLEIPAAVALPENLPNGNTRVATFYAVGVQKYKAREKAGNPGVFEWVFVAPQAELYDTNNAQVGIHGAGPFWQLSAADIIFAQHFSPQRTAPSDDPESIDWLLLKAKDGTTPTGIFADVDYIQRIATKGGKAPLTPPASADETIEVKYKAVYRFSKINP